MMFTLVYSGEHWVIDTLIGVGYAVVVLLAITGLERRAPTVTATVPGNPATAPTSARTPARQMWQPSQMSTRPPAAGKPAEPMPTPAGLADTIARLRRAMRRGARVADPANTLAVAQLELLACVADHPGIRPSHLAKLLNLRPNTVTTLVNALAAQDMIDRSAADGDGRAVALTVTDAGRRAVHAWQATNGAVLNLALSTLTAAQRNALTKAVPALGALAVAIDQLADTQPSRIDRLGPWTAPLLAAWPCGADSLRCRARSSALPNRY